MNKKQRKQRRLKIRRKQKELRKQNQEAEEKAKKAAERAARSAARQASEASHKDALELAMAIASAVKRAEETIDGPILYSAVEMIAMMRVAEAAEPERLKTVFEELGRPFDDATREAIAESVKNTFNTYKYPLFKNGKIYYGMPEPDVNLPFAGTVVLKLQGMRMGSILAGKDEIGEQLVRNPYREYRFDVNFDSPDFGICFLYIEGPENHFKNEALKTLPLLDNGQTQKIPLIYSVLSQMTDEEVWVIWHDLD